MLLILDLKSLYFKTATWPRYGHCVSILYSSDNCYALL